MQSKSKANRIITLVIIIILAALFTFPLYWIITGSFKTAKEVNSVTPVWWPSEWTLKNYQTLMSKLKAPLWEFYIPFSQYFSADGSPIVFSAGSHRARVRSAGCSTPCGWPSQPCSSPARPPRSRGMRWPRSASSDAASFTLIVCAMALPKQVILIPLIREMSSLKLYNTLSAVVYPIVGWPFGVFLIKQFAESIPSEILEAARIDGASELKTFNRIVFPMIKPGVGALAIFTFINSWNDYFMQLIMLSSTKNLTISLGIAKMQAENSTDFGLIMAGAAFAAVPIIIVFLIFQKYFTKGITMGAVKG